MPNWSARPYEILRLLEEEERVRQRTPDRQGAVTAKAKRLGPQFSVPRRAKTDLPALPKLA